MKALESKQIQKVGYPRNWDRWRRLVKMMAGYRCQKCGVGGGRVKLAVHHIIPLSKGGSTSFGNLICLCERCHSMSHSRRGTRNIREDPWEFLFRFLQSS